MRSAATALLCILGTTGMAQAGLIERACLGSDRPAVTRALCGCIQAVADKTLSGSDQRLAAEFFADPHRAQVIRQSDVTAHEVFWERYKNFGATATKSCS